LGIARGRCDHDVGSDSILLGGLVKPPKNEVKIRYTAYLEAHFPDLCQALGGGATGAEAFYDNFRVKAAHELL
jgi:hypothetical protein